MEIAFTEDAKRKFAILNLIRPHFLINNPMEATEITKHDENACTISQESEGRALACFKSRASSVSSVQLSLDLKWHLNDEVASLPVE